ncbi:unnamed protein product, partial [marine sediment metagenome]
MFDINILLDLSIVLTEFTYKLEKYPQIFRNLKNLYDAMGFYLYNDDHTLYIWGYLHVIEYKLQKITPVEDEDLFYHTRDVLNRIRYTLESKHRPYTYENLPVFEEESQEELEIKKLAWRFGSSLVIYRRGVGNFQHPFVQLLVEFFEFLNKALYGLIALSEIEKDIPHWEKRVNTFRDTIENAGRRLYIIMMEFDLTKSELKKIFYKPEEEFVVNEYITLKLDSGGTNIYICGKLFNQCNYLLLNLPVDKLGDFEEINSIDEVADMLNWTFDGQLDIHDKPLPYKIPLETEFWGHCSNLQAWAENNYD